MILDGADFADVLGDPRAPEVFSAAGGEPIVVVELTTARDAARLATAAPAGCSLPAVVVVLARDPGVVTPGIAQLADLVLTDAPRPGAPCVGPESAGAEGLLTLERAVRRHPLAAAALVLHLRASAGLPTEAGLTAESAAYAALQAGTEFLTWRAAHAPRPAEPSGPRIRLSREGSTLHLTLARPTRRNAFDVAMRDAVAEALVIVATDTALALVVDGDGPDFCAGGDLDEFGLRRDPAEAHIVRLSRHPARLLAAIAARTTFRVHGSCLGAGIELPAFAGRVVVTGPARFGLPELSLGLMPGAGGSVSLPRRIGRHRTAWLALSGLTVDEGCAHDWGLVDALDDA